MSNVPSDLHYTETHEWVREEDDGTFTVGITDHAQHALGDIVHVELPEADSEITSGDEIAVLESVKAAADIYAPVNGTITAVNEALNDNPELVNSDAYGSGWLFSLTPDDATELNDLFTADEYSDQLEEE